MTDDDHGEAIGRFNAALAIGFETADFEALQDLYTEGSVLLPARNRPLRGRAAIVAFWTGVRNRFSGMVFRTGEFKPLGADVARETGVYEMHAGDGGGAPPAGKYMIVWQKAEGAWRIESSIWTRNQEAGQRQPGQGAGQGGMAPEARPQRQGAPRDRGRDQGQGLYRQGGGERNDGRRPGYGGARDQGGMAGPRGGIAGGGSGLGGGGRRGPQAGGRAQGAASLYDDTSGLYSNRDD